jgi:FAD/FMN-containing dehydrogenase
MESLLLELEKIFKGEIDSSKTTREAYSHDASIFEIEPQAVVFPQNTHDIKSLVHFVALNRQFYPELSITPRSGGTDMSGGAIGDSLVVDMTRHFNKIKKVTSTSAHLQPGVFYRDFDPISIKHNAQIGSVPASRMICTVGGMVANNSGGERSLQFGNTENFVAELSVVFADGNEYIVKPLTKKELTAKMKQGDFEGNLYKRVYELIESDYDRISTARPHTHKNSMGYNLWAVWSRTTGIFDMTKLIVGSQGTLGIVTDITFKLVPRHPHSGILVCFLSQTDQLGDIINVVLGHKPSTFEGFDDITYDLAFKFYKSFRTTLGAKEYLRVQKDVLADRLRFKKRTPKLVLMVEFEDKTSVGVLKKIQDMQADLLQFEGVQTEIEHDEIESQRFWTIRRASFSLLRQKVKDKFAAPFIDDLAVQPKYLPEFLPALRTIIKKYQLPATLAGHFGDGNFHIIPLMSIEAPHEQAKLEPAMREIVKLVLSYEGTLAGEHNEGMIRGPWLEAMFGKEMVGHFRTVKNIFDPQKIFNPHKKVDADWQYSMDHVRKAAKKGII